MKRILINATHNEEVRVALCKGNHLYDFDLENRTREQKKANIYKGHVTRVEPSLEAVFVEYGSKRQGFLPVREIASEYLSGNPREENIRKLIKEGDELIVQVEKEERGNKGAALSTYVSLAGRYLVLMPNNPKGGGISRQISGKLREDMKRMLGELDLPKGMSVIVRTAGIGKTQEDLQHDLNHLLNIWNAIQDQNKKYASPRLVHQEAGVVTRAVRDYLRDDIAEIWIDNEEAFIEAETFIKAVMPTQIEKLRKYTDFEPMFSNFNVERQIETAYQREVRLPSGGSIVIDQTEALVSIDINSAKSTKGADVSETAFHTNLEAADEIARQLRLRDMGGLIVIDFIDMNENKHQKEVEKRLVEATKYDRARVQFGEISRFGLMEMSRQRLRPSLEESTGYICPRCHGNGMIRDLRSLSLSIMRQIEQTALKERHGEVQAEVPTDVAAFLLNEKRESLVYLEQDSGTRITILPHAHLESPNFNLHFNHQGFAPASYERVTDTQQQENSGLGYDVDWQTAESERPEQQPSRQPRQQDSDSIHKAAKQSVQAAPSGRSETAIQQNQAQVTQSKPAAVAWLSNLFAPTPAAQMSATVSSADAAQAIEEIVNTGAQSRGVFGHVDSTAVATQPVETKTSDKKASRSSDSKDDDSDNSKDRRRSRNSRNRNKNDKRSERNKTENRRRNKDKDTKKSADTADKHQQKNESTTDLPKREANSKRDSRGAIERGETKQPQNKSNHDQQDRNAQQQNKQESNQAHNKSADKSNSHVQNERQVDPNEVNLRVTEAETTLKTPEVVHISLDDSKANTKAEETKAKPSQEAQQQPEDNKETASATEAHVSKSTENPATTPSDSSTQHDTAATAQVSDNKAGKATARDDSASKTETSAVGNSQAKTGLQADQSEAVATESEDNRLGFDSSTIFSDRYITAEKYGQAANDPRVIKAAVQKKLKQHTEQAKSVATTPVETSITGTVGQFIHTHLAQPRMRLAKDGVIACFLAALNAHKETSGSVKPARKSKANAAKPTDLEALKSFSFVNYGYKTLSPSYLQRFEKMTSAVAQHNIEQGKTAVAPAPIGARAANDPRGQHPDYKPQLQAPEVSTTGETEEVESSKISEADTMAETPATVEATTDTTQAATESMVDLLKLNVGGFIDKVLGPEGIDLINAGQTEAAFLKALRQPFATLASAVTNQADSDEDNADDTHDNSAETEPTVDQQVQQGLEQPASALIDEPSAGSISEENEEKLAKSQQDSLEDSADQNAANVSNKTSIETYKSMIENISEQLLPQKPGLLNLTTPTPKKVPKTRSRKAKDDSKKTAEEVNKGNTDSHDHASIEGDDNKQTNNDDM